MACDCPYKRRADIFLAASRELRLINYDLQLRIFRLRKELEVAKEEARAIASAYLCSCIEPEKDTEC